MGLLYPVFGGKNNELAYEEENNGEQEEYVNILAPFVSEVFDNPDDKKCTAKDVDIRSHRILLRFSSKENHTRTRGSDHQPQDGRP